MDEAEQLKAHHARLRLRAATDPVAWEHHLHETEALKVNPADPRDTSGRTAQNRLIS